MFGITMVIIKLRNYLVAINFYDILLLKSNFKVYNFFKFNEYFYKNLIEETALHKFKKQLLTIFDSETIIYKIVINK